MGKSGTTSNWQEKKERNTMLQRRQEEVGMSYNNRDNVVEALGNLSPAKLPKIALKLHQVN